MERIADDVWGFERDLRLPIGALPCRTTIMRQRDGKLVVHAPLKIDDARAKEIDALGEVAYLVAPNCFHWLYLKAAKERYPHAKVFAPKSLAKKLGDFRFEPLPDRGAFCDDVDVRFVQGAPSMDEHVFLHRPSSTLVVGDLLFNLHRAEGALFRLILKLGGTWKKPAQSKIWRFIVKDKEATVTSVGDMLSWSFDRIVMAHGEVITENAAETARQALSWLAPRMMPRLSAG